jgi:hypothetical protein
MPVACKPEDVTSTAVLPRRLADIFRPELASLANEIVDEIRATIPEYARPLNGPYGKSIRAGVQYALTLFVDQIADPDSSVHECHEVHRKLGQNEMHEGRSLDALQAAHRVGARVAWRRIMRVGKRNGLSSTVMSQLADSVFAFMDELASVALDGYLEAKACTAGALETWRRRLLRLILETPPAPPKAIAELAQLIGWVVPAEACPVAVQALPGTGHNQRRSMLDADILAELDGVEPHLLVPGEMTAARLASLRAALPESRFSVAPCVPLDSVADALRWARRALVLADEGVIRTGQVTFCEEHLATVLVHSDDRLVVQLGRRLFAPLQGLTVKQRERMLETLRAWLDAQGSVPDMAARLNVHPQTVRYRMRQLEAAFAGRLDDPDARFEMELVLRSQAPRSGSTGSVRREVAPDRLGALVPAPRSY